MWLQGKRHAKPASEEVTNLKDLLLDEKDRPPPTRDPEPQP